MDYAPEVQRTAVRFVEKYGEGAVEVIRQLCLEAHRKGDAVAFQLSRDIGVAADEILMARLEAHEK
jgi:hypothetical protein